MITFTMPEWLAWLFIAYITVDLILTGINIWYKWRINKTKKL